MIVLITRRLLAISKSFLLRHDPTRIRAKSGIRSLPLIHLLTWAGSYPISDASQRWDFSMSLRRPLIHSPGVGVPGSRPARDLRALFGIPPLNGVVARINRFHIFVRFDRLDY